MSPLLVVQSSCLLYGPQVIHAPRCLYMVTDRAGRDLFDFFDEHLEGISEDSACLLMHKVTNVLGVVK